MPESLGFTRCWTHFTFQVDGNWSDHMWRFEASFFNHCRGIDNRELKTSHERQSVSAEINYGIRFNEVMITLKVLMQPNV